MTGASRQAYSAHLRERREAVIADLIALCAKADGRALTPAERTAWDQHCARLRYIDGLITCAGCGADDPAGHGECWWCRELRRVTGANDVVRAKAAAAASVRDRRKPATARRIAVLYFAIYLVIVTATAFLVSR